MNEFTIVAMKQAYAEELNTDEYHRCDSKFESMEYCHQIAEKMVANVKNDKSRHDYLKYNQAMRRSAKRFGIKTTRQFREMLRAQ